MIFSQVGGCKTTAIARFSTLFICNITLQLGHASQGEGKQRHLVLSKGGPKKVEAEKENQARIDTGNFSCQSPL